MWALSMIVGLLVVLAITAATGYFVAQEFSYMAVDRSRLKARAATGDQAAKRALAVTRRTSFMLSGAQLGITVTALLVGYVAEPLIGAALGEALGGVGVPMTAGVAIGTVSALVFATFVQMLFGELFPKNLAIARPEPVAVRLATSTTVYLKLFGWLIAVFDRASNLLLRTVRIEPVHDVEHAMIPRSVVDVVRDDESLDDVWRYMSTGHSRYPVLDEDDQVVGVVRLQDVLELPGRDGVLVTSLMKDPLLVPTSMSLPDALRLLAGTRNQMACVLDEYGGFAGVLTIEDLAEEVVGEITDEHDPVELAPIAERTGSWLMAGMVPIDEVERTIDHDLPVGDYETLAGLVITRHGSLPPVGTVVRVELPLDPVDLAEAGPPAPEFLRLEVVELERHVPSRVQVTLEDADDTPDAAAEGDARAGGSAGEDGG